MKLPGPRQYPKQIFINDETWKIKFCSIHDDGECDPEHYEIRIKKGLCRAETFKVFIHEVLHAFEFSYDVYIDESKDHPLIYFLEGAIFNFLVENF